MKAIDENQQSILNTRMLSNIAIAQHDLTTLLNCWLDDIVIIRGNGDIIFNKAAAAIVWRELFEKHPEICFVRETEEINISKNNTLAWEKGRWRGINTYSGGGKYSAMWKKYNNEWKLQAELFVSLD
ncbi:MAG: nuclear transport factor 2 family protein [Parafilimonas sp.]|nr:nuclear transport factor 2 family protein [Parafilimonas sp.]